MRRTYWYAGLAALPELGQGAQPGNDRGCGATQPFDFAQGRELVERQMDFLRSRHPSSPAVDSVRANANN